MDANELFKKLVRDAKEPHDEALLQNPRPIMSYGSQLREWFEMCGGRKKHPGRFMHLTDEYIDSLSDEHLENEMVMFIYSCFQQR